MIRLTDRVPGEKGAWGRGCVMCFSVTTGLPSPLSPQSPARPPRTPACCLPALRWTGGVMIPTPPHICRHTWTVSQWAPRAPLPQVSHRFPQAAQRWPSELLLPGDLPSLTVYLKTTSLLCVVMCLTLRCSFLWGKLIEKGNSAKLVRNLTPYTQKAKSFFLNLVTEVVHENVTWDCEFSEERLLAKFSSEGPPSCRVSAYRKTSHPPGFLYASHCSRWNATWISRDHFITKVLKTYKEKEGFFFPFPLLGGGRGMCKNVIWFLKVLLLLVTLENIYILNTVKMLESIGFFFFSF